MLLGVVGVGNARGISSAMKAHAEWMCDGCDQLGTVLPCYPSVSLSDRFDAVVLDATGAFGGSSRKVSWTIASWVPRGTAAPRCRIASATEGPWMLYESECGLRSLYVIDVAV